MKDHGEKVHQVDMSNNYEPQLKRSISAVVFDFGGVLAEEGFREGLFAIARMCNLNMHAFFNAATETIYETGYLTGHSSEGDYWEALRQAGNINLSDETMKNEIIKRFVIRKPMIQLVRILRGKHFRVIILSDQTNWLDEINQRDHFYHKFDLVLNSYDLGKSKRDINIFRDLAANLGQDPSTILFVDDNHGHVERARMVGIQGITFSNVPDLLVKLQSMNLLSGAESGEILSTNQD